MPIHPCFSTTRGTQTFVQGSLNWLVDTYRLVDEAHSLLSYNESLEAYCMVQAFGSLLKSLSMILIISIWLFI